MLPGTPSKKENKRYMSIIEQLKITKFVSEHGTNWKNNQEKIEAAFPKYTYTQI